MTIGERIKQRRLELGLSADDVALALGKNRATIYRYESNDIEKLPTTVLEPLAEVLKTTPADLMGWEEEENKKPPATELREQLDSICETMPEEQQQELLRYARYLHDQSAQKE